MVRTEPTEPLAESAELIATTPENERFVRAILWLGALLVSAYLTWSARYGITVDGLSYLDIADAFFRRDWGNAINAYWSPLYSWVLGFGLWVLKPSPYWEFPAVQFINFVISVFSLVCFGHFWRVLGEVRDLGFLRPEEMQMVSFSRKAWLILGYSLFIWTIVRATIVSVVTPDLLVAGIVFLIASVIVRMRAGYTGFAAFLFLGPLLGISYLAKSAMFVFSFVFLGVSFLAVANTRKAVSRSLTALTIFLAISAPFIAAISRNKGHLTIGEAGKINYAWDVNKSAPFFNWQPGNAAAGVPLHPTRKLLSSPTLYEFATPIGGTYPPHFDPSYWNAGLTPHFNFKQQLRALVTSGYSFYSSFFVPQAGLCAGVLVLLVLAGKPGLRRLWESWHLWFPGIAATGMYALVTLEHRYVGPFVVLIWAAILSSIRLPPALWTRKLLSSVAIIGSFTLLLSAFEQIATRMYEMKERSTNGNWQIADGLGRLGIHPGENVVSLGSAYDAYWAHLARVKVVAEIPSSDVLTFWALDPAAQSEVLATCRRIGARAIVASETPKGAVRPGWARLGNTDFYAHLLPDLGKPQ